MSRTKKQRRQFRRELRRNPGMPQRLEDDSRDFVPPRRAYGDYLITWEQLNLAGEADPVFDQLSDEQRKALFDQTTKDPKAAIAALTELLERSPNSRTLRNWLTMAYSAIGDQEATEREARITYERHPDYLYARIAWAQLCLQRGQVDEVPKIFDGKFDLKALYPERDVFHITEFLGFARLMAEYYMRTHRQAEGESLYRAMKKMEPDHPLTQQMRHVIAGLQALRRVEKSDFRSELARIFQRQLEQGFEWRWDGLEDWTTDAIFTQLRDLGIDTDAERFPRQAEVAGGFKALEQDWSRQILDEKKPGFWEDFPFLAVQVLWMRLASNLVCPELIEERLYRAVQAGENENPLPTVNGIPCDIDAALLLARYLQGFAAAERPDRYQEIVTGGDYDYASWLLELIESRVPEYPDAATEIADAMSHYGEQAERFQAVLALALAAAGRGDEARTRALGNVQRFPDDIWVRILAGDVFAQIGDEAEAIRLWREALPMALNYSDWKAVIDRMEDLFNQSGRRTELEEIIRMYPEPHSDVSQPTDPPEVFTPFAETEPLEELEPLTRASKVGRNDPCPCGSGKKYKKCCLS